jgi:hypothetical protein
MLNYSGYNMQRSIKQMQEMEQRKLEQRLEDVNLMLAGCIILILALAVALVLA